MARYTQAMHIASVLAGKGEITVKAEMRAVMARLPESQVAEIDAMAKLSRKTRSAMIVHLLNASLEAVRHASDKNTLKLIDQEVFTALQASDRLTSDLEKGEV